MNAPLPLSVTLTMDEGTRNVLAQDEHALETARAYEIDSPTMADLANEELRGVKSRIKRLKELKEGFVAPAKQILENAAALFNPALESLTAAEGVLKVALTNWTTEQERIAAEARRLAQEEQRRAQQEQERIAAVERAKAQEKAREQERIAQEAENARLAAIEAGNAKEAAKQAALAASATEKALAVVENAEVKAMESQVAVQAAASVIAAPQKIAGFSTRDSWSAELAPGETEAGAVTKIALAIASGRTELAGQLMRNTPSNNQLAKALKGAFNVPGLVAVNKPVAASRAA